MLYVAIFQASCFVSRVGSDIRYWFALKDSLDFLERFAGLIEGPAPPCGDAPDRQAHQEIISCDVQFRRVEPLAVSQTVDVLALHQQPGHFAYSPSDICLAHAGQPGYLSKTAAILQVHFHQDLVVAAKHIRLVVQQINCPAMPDSTF